MNTRGSDMRYRTGMFIIGVLSLVVMVLTGVILGSGNLDSKVKESVQIHQAPLKVAVDQINVSMAIIRRDVRELRAALIGTPSGGMISGTQ